MRHTPISAITRSIAIYFVILATIPGANAKSPKTLPGPVPAIVEKVIDGDTLAVKATIWVGQDVQVLVRIDGVDTPELSGKCHAAKAKARKARKFVTRLVSGRKVHLTNIRRGKYAGRVIAKVKMTNGDDLGNLLLRTKLAVPYKKRRYANWCCKNGQCKNKKTKLSAFSYPPTP